MPTYLLILTAARLIHLGTYLSSMYGQFLRLGFVLGMYMTYVCVRVRRKNPWPDVARPGFR